MFRKAGEGGVYGNYIEARLPGVVVVVHMWLRAWWCGVGVGACNTFTFSGKQVDKTSQPGGLRNRAREQARQGREGDRQKEGAERRGARSVPESSQCLVVEVVAVSVVLVVALVTTSTPW